MSMDSIRMLEMMLSIPGVHVCEAGQVDGEPRIEIETSVTASRCSVCDAPAEAVNGTMIGHWRVSQLSVNSHSGGTWGSKTA